MPAPTTNTIAARETIAKRSLCLWTYPLLMPTVFPPLREVSTDTAGREPCLQVAIYCGGTTIAASRLSRGPDGRRLGSLQGSLKLGRRATRPVRSLEGRLIS